jgi:dTDP-glucose 4,6-dehydratase
VCTEHEVVVLDKLTSAGRRENLAGLPVALVVGGIEDRALAREVMSGCEAVVNFAAESYVDRSIADQDVFARAHLMGISILLDAARELEVGRDLQVSTDEVYGSVESGSFTEHSPPRRPRPTRRARPLATSSRRRTSTHTAGRP